MSRRLEIRFCLAIIWLLLAVFRVPATAKTIYVDDDGPADFNNIQSAIDDSNDGDVIVVAEGTYFENINFKGKNIILRSTDPNNPDVIAATVIDGQQNGSVVTFNSGEDVNCVLSGFTVTGGNAQHGGGIYCAGKERWWDIGNSPTLINLIIIGNSAEFWGGGMANNALSIPTLKNCIFYDNYSRDGGGIYNEGSPRLFYCVFRENNASNRGGGMANYDAVGSPILNGCVFEGNSALFGGGMDNDETNVTLINSIFIVNSAGDDGGGMHNSYNNLTAVNCIFSGNLAIDHGGGMYNHAINLVLTNCTFNGNSANNIGGGMFSWENGQMFLLDSIIYANTPTDLSGIQPSQVFYSNISQEGFAGINGNICADPCFADPFNGDYHLKSQAGRWDVNEGRWTKDEVTSPCIDAGDPMSPIGREPFPNGGIINMGAYGGTEEASKSYFGKPICETIVAGDINGDCKVNLKDFALIAYHWLEER